MSGMDKIPTQDEYENVLKGDVDLNNKIMKLGSIFSLLLKKLLLNW